MYFWTVDDIFQHRSISASPLPLSLCFCCPLLYLTCVFLFCVGVLEQAPELGVRTFAAYWPGHGHREHTALRRLQQTEYHTRRESRRHADIPACFNAKLVARFKTKLHISNYCKILICRYIVQRLIIEQVQSVFFSSTKVFFKDSC